MPDRHLQARLGRSAAAAARDARCALREHGVRAARRRSAARSAVQQRPTRLRQPAALRRPSRFVRRACCSLFSGTQRRTASRARGRSTSTSDEDESTGSMISRLYATDLARARTSPSAGGCPTAASRSLHFGPDAGRAEPPAHLAVRRRARVRSNTKMSCIVMTSPSMPVISEIAGDLARAVRQARHLHDEVDGRGDLLADGPLRDVQVRHRHHRVEAVQRVARRCWRGSSSSCRRGRCSSPAACRALLRRGPRRR